MQSQTDVLHGQMKLSRLIELLTKYLEVYGDGDLSLLALGRLILTMINEVSEISSKV
jgi:hypothetical protein